MFKKCRFAADLSSKKPFQEKKTFATISVVISSSSWLLRAMDPCRLLLDFKNRLFAPSKKTITFKKKLSLQKTRRFARSKKNYQLQKKTRRFAPKRSKKNSKKNSSRFAADFVQKKTPKRSKKLQNSFFFERICSKKNTVDDCYNWTTILHQFA